jgi:nucleotide-binding universal stress UspA family protein
MNILVPVDFSAATRPVVAAAIAQAQGREAHLWLIHVAEPEPEFVGYGAGPRGVRTHVAHELRKEHRELNELAEQIRGSGVVVTPRFVRGATVDTILAQATEHAADLIVMGTHGRGVVYQVLVGSVSEGVLHRATCPVLLVPVRHAQPKEHPVAEQAGVFL